MIAPDAQRRLEILGFWRRHGLAATREAFKISRRTLYPVAGQAQGRGGQRGGPGAGLDRAEATPAAAVAGADGDRDPPPAHRCIPTWPKRSCTCCSGPFAAAAQLPCPSARTIGRLIADAPDKMRSPTAALRGPGQSQAGAPAAPAQAQAFPRRASRPLRSPGQHRTARRERIAATSSPAPICIPTSPGPGPPAATPAPPPPSSSA